jgi:transducin (beta)-like 1
VIDLCFAFLVIHNFVGIDCCLDVEWLSENTFASAGADMHIIIMQVDKDDPIKTLKSVSVPIVQAKTNWIG